MAKLYFRYGTMGSAKTLNLLAVAHSYHSQGKRVLILKPELDSRFGTQTVRSRSGLEKEADVLVRPDSRLESELLVGLHCILVDESQFLSADFVDHLRAVSIDFDIPVICYGLRTDFRTQLFEGSKRLTELADCIEEIKSTCARCNRKAIFNMRLISGRPTVDGPTVQLGAEESYQPMCSKCYFDAFKTRRENAFYEEQTLRTDL
jgi:thymidine kinase